MIIEEKNTCSRCGIFTENGRSYDIGRQTGFPLPDPWLCQKCGKNPKTVNKFIKAFIEWRKSDVVYYSYLVIKNDIFRDDVL